MTVSQQQTHASPPDSTARRFYVSNGSFSFNRQYSKIYAARLSSAKPWLINAASRTWNAASEEHLSPGKMPIRSLNNLVNDERCVIIGTIYKEMKKKPSVLRELAGSEAMRSLMHEDNEEPLNSDTPSKYFSPDDSVFLEDDVQRILLNMDATTMKSKVSSTNLITGVVLALLGFEPQKDPGTFQVEDVLFLEPQPERPITAHPCSSGVNPTDCVEFRSSGPWLALVSGLEFTGTGPLRAGHSMALQLLADWLRCSGDWTASAKDGVGVVRLMIVGDSILTPISRAISQQARYLTRNMEADSVTAMTRLDTWLSSLPLGPGHISETSTNGFPVDLLPGPSDPTSPFLPQQPVHSTAFPITTSRFGDGLHGRTNPYLCNIFDRTVLATAGQGINDMLQYTDIEDPCDRMEAILLWGHLAPSCPDTLPSYPLSSHDLLLLQQRNDASPDYPDIFVAGCQPGSKPRWRHARLRWNSRGEECDGGALLIALPRFSVSRSLVLVHLETLDCRVVQFDTSAIDALEQD